MCAKIKKTIDGLERNKTIVKDTKHSCRIINQSFYCDQLHDTKTVLRYKSGHFCSVPCLVFSFSFTPL